MADPTESIRGTASADQSYLEDLRKLGVPEQTLRQLATVSSQRDVAGRRLADIQRKVDEAIADEDTILVKKLTPMLSAASNDFNRLQTAYDRASTQAEKYVDDARLAAKGSGSGRTAFPWEEQAGWLEVQKRQQDLMSPYVLAQQQVNEAIDQLSKDLSLSPEDRNKRMGLVWDNFYSTLEGTTPYQKKKDKSLLARDVMSDRMSTGSTMAQGLMRGLGDIYSKIYSSANPPYNYDPFSMANSYMDQSQGGPEINQLAQSLLRGALGGQ